MVIDQVLKRFGTTVPFNVCWCIYFYTQNSLQHVINMYSVWHHCLTLSSSSHYWIDYRQQASFPQSVYCLALQCRNSAIIYKTFCSGSTSHCFSLHFSLPHICWDARTTKVYNNITNEQLKFVPHLKALKHWGCEGSTHSDFTCLSGCFNHLPFKYRLHSLTCKTDILYIRNTLSAVPTVWRQWKAASQFVSWTWSSSLNFVTLETDNVTVTLTFCSS